MVRVLAGVFVGVADLGTGRGLYGVSGATIGAPGLALIGTAAGPEATVSLVPPATVVSVPAAGVNVPFVVGTDAPLPDQTTSNVAPLSVTGTSATPLLVRLPCTHIATSAVRSNVQVPSAARVPVAWGALSSTSGRWP